MSVVGIYNTTGFKCKFYRRWDGVLSYDKVVVISILPNRGWKIDRLLACRLVDLHRVAATVVTGEGLQILVCSVVEPCNRQDAFAAARPDIKTDIEKKR